MLAGDGKTTPQKIGLRGPKVAYSITRKDLMTEATKKTIAVPTPPGEWLRPREAAKYLGKSVGALSQMRVMETGPAYFKHRSRFILYSKEALDVWIAEGTTQTGTRGKRKQERLAQQKISSRTKERMRQ